MKQTYVDNNK